MNRFIICDQSALGRGGHYLEYSLCVAKAAQKKGFQVHILCNRRLDVSIIKMENIEIHPIFSNTWGETEASGLPSYGLGHIVYETEMALLHVGAGPMDHVLLHTLGLVELRAWIAFLIDIPLYRLKELPVFHFLMRFDPESLEIDTSLDWAALRRQLQMRQEILQSHVHWCSDTDRLADRYAKQLGMPVTVAPIPFDQTPLMALLNKKQLNRSHVVTVVYLGDARLEKGFECFGRLVTELWESHLKPHKLRFVFQANTNVPGGEGNILQVIRSLGQYPASMVELVHHAMNPEEYFQRLVDSDIVLIPYSSSRYHSRSSGVLIEALAAGKPIITTAGSWMATQVNDKHAIIIDDKKKLASALLELLRRLPTMKKAAQQIAASWQKNSSPENYIAHLIESVPSGRDLLAGEAVATVLYVMDGDAIVLRNGASRVAFRQLKYLFSRNFRVIGVFIATHYSRTPDECIEWSRQLGQELRDLPFATVHVLSVNPAVRDGKEFQYLQQQKQLNAYSILRDIRLAEALSIPNGLLNQIRTNPPNLILLNYVVYYPILLALGVDHLPIVCETHDIQSFQKAIYGQRMVATEDIRQELKLLSKCQYLISLNDVETILIKEYLPAVPCATVHMAFDLMWTSSAMLAGYCNLAELVAGCGPDSPMFRNANLPAHDLSEDQQRLIVFGSHLDLLYVSSSHQSNVSGLKWFLDHVFFPVLVAQGVTMIVAGSIKYACDWPKSPNLVFVGRLDDLTPLYAACKLCVLPIIEGAGSPIKTFEALAYGKPVIGTNLAFRGLPEVLLSQMIEADDENAMAKSIQKMLKNSKARKKYAENLRVALSSLASKQQYFVAMDKAVLIAGGIKCKHEEMPMGKAEETNTWISTEWGDDIQLANLMFGAWFWQRDVDESALTKAKQYSISKLTKMLEVSLPLVLSCGIAIGIPLGVKERLLKETKKTVETLLSIFGIIKNTFEHTSFSMKTSVVLHGAMKNIVIIQLDQTTQRGLDFPEVVVRGDGKVLKKSNTRAQDGSVVLCYELQLDTTFLSFQQVLLEVDIPSDCGWEIKNILLKEDISIEKLRSCGYSRIGFHNLETAPDGKVFAWTAAQQVNVYLPSWFGVSKLLILDAYSMRKNQPTDVDIVIRNKTFAFQTSRQNELGEIYVPLTGDILSPFRNNAVIKTTYFEQASQSDQRMIGIAMHGFSLSSAIV